MKNRIVLWLISLLKSDYVLVRKERLIAIAQMVNNRPMTKVPTISLIRLWNGNDFADALRMWNEWNSE